MIMEREGCVIEGKEGDEIFGPRLRVIRKRGRLMLAKNLDLYKGEIWKLRIRRKGLGVLFLFTFPLSKHMHS